MTNSSHPLWYLKHYDLFSGISPKEIERIATETTMNDYAQESVLYKPYEMTDLLYVVKKGEVQLYHTRDGKTYVFDTLTAGDVFGNISLTDTNVGHFAKAQPGSCVCAFRRADFLAIIKEYPEVMLRYMQEMGGRILDYQSQMQNQHATANEIVLNELHRLNAKRGKTFMERIVDRPLRITHEELARLTGLNRVTVTRSMKSLREQGDITYDPQTGIITLQ